MVNARVSKGLDRPENELLLSCARVNLDFETATRVGELSHEKMDWAYILQTASRHGLLPLLHWHLNRVCPESVPQPTRNHLSEHFQVNARHNLFLTGELLKLLHLLETHSIPAIPFKGPVLAVSVYGNLALREFSDLDILLPKADIQKANELLCSQGYRPYYKLTGEQEATFLQGQCEYLLVRNDDRVLVDSHWHLTPAYFSFSLDLERLWERCTSLSMGGAEVRTFSPEDLLLILCVHGAKHLWNRLEWLCGVAELIRTHKEMDWDWVMKQASMLGSERMCLLGFFLARDLLGADLPERVVQTVQTDASVQALAAQVQQRLFPETYAPPEVFTRALFHLMVRERLQDRVQYCFRLLTTPTPKELALLPLPASLFFLYHLMRPIRLVCKHGLGALRQGYARLNRLIGAVKKYLTLSDSLL